MKINGKIITGMYVYSPKVEYTKDDFVIHSGVIYICTKDVVSGDEGPGNSDCFRVYLGDKSVNSEEYLNFLETGEGDNKYISVEMLQTAMSYYLHGPTGKGIIGDYICYDPESLNITIRLSNINTEDFTDPREVISSIMSHPNINHAHMRISRFLPEISGYVGGGLGISEENSGEDQRSVILRQYTYKTTEGMTRLQELIDPIDGVIWYRSGVLLEGANLSGVTPWACSVINSRALKTKVENLIRIYTSRLKVLDSMEMHLKSNFRYRTFPILKANQKSITFGTDIVGHEITVTITEIHPEEYRQNYETTINLGNKINGGIPDYLIGNKYILRTTGTDEIGYTISILLLDSEISPENAYISGLYYKEYYGLS